MGEIAIKKARGVYREAVTSQSPGLLQPWVTSTIYKLTNPERVASEASRMIINHRGEKLLAVSRSAANATQQTSNFLFS